MGGVVDSSSQDGRSYSPGKNSSKKNRSSKSRKFSNSKHSLTRQQPAVSIKVNAAKVTTIGTNLGTPKNSGGGQNRIGNQILSPKANP